MSRILVVDDAAANRYLLETVLKAEGFEVTPAKNGAEALALAKESPPDLVVTDILMPSMDGFDLCRQWRANGVLSRIPFVFYTAYYTDPRDEEFALRLGADRFLVKPLDPKVLVATVRELIEAHGGAQPSTAARPREAYEGALARKMKALRASEATYRGLFEASRDALLIVDEATGRIVDANPCLERLAGRSRDELIGRTAREAGLFADPPALEAALSELRSRGHVRRALALTRGDGRRVEAEAVGSAYDADGTALFVLGFRQQLPGT